jgi:hypothetical protein
LGPKTTPLGLCVMRAPLYGAAVLLSCLEKWKMESSSMHKRAEGN